MIRLPPFHRKVSAKLQNSPLTLLRIGQPSSKADCWPHDTISHFCHAWRVYVPSIAGCPWAWRYEWRIIRTYPTIFDLPWLEQVPSLKLTNTQQKWCHLAMIWTRRPRGCRKQLIPTVSGDRPSTMAQQHITWTASKHILGNHLTLLPVSLWFFRLREKILPETQLKSAGLKRVPIYKPPELHEKNKYL